MVNNKCPYCNSADMTLDCDVRISGRLYEDGTIRINPWWTIDTLETESVSGCDSHDIQGFCGNCGEYCSFDWDKGFIEGGGIDDV